MGYSRVFHIWLKISSKKNQWKFNLRGLKYEKEIIIIGKNNNRKQLDYGLQRYNGVEILIGFYFYSL